jgi:hypothetical protein
MTIAIGQVGYANLNDSQSSYTITTGGVNTNATGSAFVLYLFTKEAIANRARIISDNKGNTYTQIGADVNNSQGYTLYRYYCANGVGGTGHTATALSASYSTGTITSTTTTTITDTSQSWTTNQWVNYSCFNTTRSQYANCTSNTSNTLTFSAIPSGSVAGDSYIIGAYKATLILTELTSAATTGLLDQSNTNSGFLGSPQSPGSITLSSVSAAGGEMMLSCYGVYGGSYTAFSESTGFTNIYSNVAPGFPADLAFAVAYKLVTTNGTYTPSWTGGGTTYIVTSVDSFQGVASGSTAAIAWVS